MCVCVYRRPAILPYVCAVTREYATCIIFMRHDSWIRHMTRYIHICVCVHTDASSSYYPVTTSHDSQASMGTNTAFIGSSDGAHTGWSNARALTLDKSSAKLQAALNQQLHYVSTGAGNAQVPHPSAPPTHTVRVSLRVHIPRDDMSVAPPDTPHLPTHRTSQHTAPPNTLHLHTPRTSTKIAVLHPPEG